MVFELVESEEIQYLGDMREILSILEMGESVDKDCRAEIDCLAGSCFGSGSGFECQSGNFSKSNSESIQSS